MAKAKGAPKRPLVLDHSRFMEGAQQHIGIVDIGSNSVRLVVYDRLNRSPFPRFNEKALCKLGSGRDGDGNLAQDAIDHTLRAVERFFAISAAMGVGRLDVLATEAVRRAPNGHLLIDGIRKRCGAEVQLLDGMQEARYSALGVVSGFFRPHGLMGDIGGGSLEVAEVLDDAVGERSVSLPLGALPVAEMLEEGHAAAKKRVDGLLKEALPPLLTDPVFYAVGGGWRALARSEIARRGNLCRVSHGFEMTAKEARTLAKEVSRSSPEQIASLPDVPSRRVETLAAAALVLDRVLKVLKPERVVFSAFGLREGWLYALLEEEERYLDPLLEGAQTLGTARARVPAFAAALGRWTDSLFPGELPEDRRLRLAACALSDIAWSHHASFRAEEIFWEALQSPLAGINHEERYFLAATLYARHGAKFGAGIAEGLEKALSPNLLRRSQILGRALQLGYRLSGSVPEILDRTVLEVEANLVRIDARGLERAPDSDAVQSRLIQLAKALGVKEWELSVS